MSSLSVLKPGTSALAVPGFVAEAAVTGSARGGLGELYQGPGPGCDRDSIAIVSLPIDLYSHATLLPADEPADILPTKKRQALADRFWAHSGLRPPKGRWAFASQLPVGKGMASSTADLTALIRALESVHGVELSCRAISQLIGPIERSDPLFIDVPSLYLSGRKRELLRSTTRMRYFVSFTVGEGEVATESVEEERLIVNYRACSHAYEELVRSMIAAITHGDRHAVALASTQSAALHQNVVPHPLYEPVRAAHRELGAMGIVLAHTGTAIGMMFDCVPDGVQRREISAFWRGMRLPERSAMAGW